MIRIAVLDDNNTHSQMVEQALIGGPHNWDEPIEVLSFESGVELLERIKTENFDCIILDRVVPDMSGDVILQWVRQYRKQYIPVIMLTSRKSGQELVELLNAGADEYMVKPFYPDELLVRVKRLIDRSKMAPQNTSPQDQAAQAKRGQVYTLHGALFDDFNLTVDHASQLIKLTEREYNLAKLLFENVGVNLSREFILQRIWNKDTKEAGRSLTTHIHLIRDKLELTVDNGWALRPVYGFGYRLDSFNNSPSHT